MYSLSNRFNVVLFNMMVGMISMGTLNYFSGFYLTEHKINEGKFTLGKIDHFIRDNYYDEHIVSFTFDLQADIQDIFNWNTNIIFLSVVCEYETEDSKKN